jgi:threonine dehydratase
VLLKREDQQPVFSFKLRGAYNKMVHLPPEQLARRDLRLGRQPCAGRGAGRAAAGLPAVIVMPVTTPKLKVDAVQALGGEVRAARRQLFRRLPARAASCSRPQGLTFVHPFDDPDVIAGQGTVAMEILRQHQGPLDAVFVAIGGGGLISGVAAYIKAVRPEVKVIGVQTADSDAMLRSVRPASACS